MFVAVDDETTNGTGVDEWMTGMVTVPTAAKDESHVVIT